LTGGAVHLSPRVGRQEQAWRLPADGAYGVRHGLERHAQLRSEIWHRSWRELEMKPLEHRGEEQEHFHPGQLLTQTLASSWKQKNVKMF